MKSALVLLAPCFEEIEAVTIIDILRRGNVAVTVAGLERGLILGSHQIAIQSDVYYKEIDALDFDILILPGGQPGSTRLKNDPLVISWIQERFKANKPLAAICAAPTVFHEAGIAKDLKITSYPSEENVFKDSQYLNDAVVKDHNVTSSRGVGTAIHFALALVADLSGVDMASEVREKILF